MKLVLPTARLLEDGGKANVQIIGSGGAAIKVAKITTGEIVEDTEADDGKDPAAQALGRKGGRARADSMTPERRAEIARRAAAKRWDPR